MGEHSGQDEVEQFRQSFPSRPWAEMENQVESWRNWALCRLLRIPTAAFFAEPGRGAKRASIRAKRVCLECEVRLECLEARIGEKYGVSGGTDHSDRKKIIRFLKQGGELSAILEKIDAETLRYPNEPVTENLVEESSDLAPGGAEEV